MASLNVTFSEEQMEELKTYINRVKDSIISAFLHKEYSVCIDTEGDATELYNILYPNGETVLEKSYKTIQEADYVVKLLNEAYKIGYSLGITSK